MDAARLLEQYRPRALSWKEMVLFPAAVALEFLNDCAANEIRILGFDAFDLPVGENIGCRLDEGLDLSTKEYWDYSVEELCEVAADIIRASEGAALFEFVLD